MGFNLRELENEKNKWVMEGLHGRERFAAVFSSLDDARLFVETGHPESRASTILVPSDVVADARGFWAHSTIVRGTGERFIGKDRVLIACS